VEVEGGAGCAGALTMRFVGVEIISTNCRASGQSDALVKTQEALLNCSCLQPFTVRGNAFDFAFTNFDLLLFHLAP
jgi:hypothetical protein